LEFRERIAEGIKTKVVTLTGMIAHGRGEAFDYILGEHTIKPAMKAMNAAVAALMTAKHPVISVNGNAAALAPKELVDLAKILNAKLEVNIFYQEEGRLEAIEKRLKEAGATEILGLDATKRATIPELSSNRRFVDPEGIFKADVVLVPLEDGDRTEALVKMGKKVIAIDLNPLSRTSIMSHITIVDNLVRAIPTMTTIAKEFISQNNPQNLQEILKNYDNKQILREVIDEIRAYLEERISLLGLKHQF
jgi:4-phosphopantoate--beta-alanine ligase